jgi:uncharacterized protein YhaN
MRFLTLDLRAFGPFDAPPPLDLSGGSRGLHLVVGPNEAGKSTTLRAIRHLLFDFPTQTDDDHVHKYDKLRLAAVLRGERGEELAFARRKARVNPLWTFDDTEPIAPNALVPFLGPVDKEKFIDLFSISHAELVAGGQLIVKGQGNLGSILFAAGSGLAKIDEVRKGLEAEVDSLFKPTGKNPAINVALAELDLARKDAEKSMLATADWVALDKVIGDLIGRKGAADADVRRVEGEKRRLERIKGALPVLGQLDQKRAELAGFGDSRVLAEGFSEKRFQAQTARDVAKQARAAAEAALEAVADDLRACGPRDSILDEAEAIGRARDELGVYRKGLASRPIEAAKLAALEADALARLQEIHPGASPDAPPPARATPGLKGRIRDAETELAALRADRKKADDEVARLVASRSARPDPLSPEAGRLARSLESAIERARAEGDLEGSLAAAQVDLAKKAAQATVNLANLPLWSGSLEDLEALAVPSTETIARFSQRIDEAVASIKRLKADLAKLEKDSRALEREEARDRESGRVVPTKQDLTLAREGRDSAWQTIRAAWLDGRSPADPAARADDFEGSIRLADELADRLRWEAEAVARQEERRSKRRELAEETTSAHEALTQVESERAEAEASWRTHWQPLGIAPLPPAEMKTWILIDRPKLVDQAQTLRDLRVDLARKAAAIEAWKGELGASLRALGEPPVGPAESLAALLNRSALAVDRVDHEALLSSTQSSRAEAEAALDAWKTRWSATVAPLGLDGEATTTQAAEVIERIEELARSIRDRDKQRVKVEKDRQGEAQYEAEVRELAGRLGVSTPDATAESTVRDLVARLTEAQRVEDRRADALQRQANETVKREEAEKQVRIAQAMLATLMVEAGCDSIEGLVEAERRSVEILNLRKEISALESQLVNLAGPIPVARLRDDATQVDPEGLEALIAEVSDQLAPLEQERDRLAEEIGATRQKLEAMDGGPAAAEAQQRVEERVSRLAIEVDRYARVRLASAVLREAVERHREANQGPVLERAGALFRALTLGSFVGLRAETDAKGEPALVGLRADGQAALKVEGMSEGTADQLYLALRLASLRTHLDAHDPMPLVLDDILVNFDDARSVAALQVLADLSAHTQVLFFTHHAHLAMLAREALPPDVLFVHELTRASRRLTGEVPGEDSPRPGRKKKGGLVCD